MLCPASGGREKPNDCGPPNYLPLERIEPIALKRLEKLCSHHTANALPRGARKGPGERELSEPLTRIPHPNRARPHSTLDSQPRAPPAIRECLQSRLSP